MTKYFFAITEKVQNKIKYTNILYYKFIQLIYQ